MPRLWSALSACDNVAHFAFGDTSMVATTDQIGSTASVLAQEAGLSRELSTRQMSMIAIGGAIGTGLFLGSSLAVHTAGPAVIACYFLGAGLALLLMGTLSEMAVAHPTAGSFGIYAELYPGPLLPERAAGHVDSDVLRDLQLYRNRSRGRHGRRSAETGTGDSARHAIHGVPADLLLHRFHDRPDRSRALAEHPAWRRGDRQSICDRVPPDADPCGHAPDELRGIDGGALQHEL